jgi:hypothetical protein
MADAATFLAPGGQDPGTAIRATVSALTTVTVGDLLFVGQGYRSHIRERTFSGVDVNGAPFAPYSTKGPFYLYPNKSATGDRKVRATAAAGRHAKTGRIGVRTPTGIKYESYAAAKAAHGSPGVTLYGMEQHPHMLDAIIVRAGGQEVSGAGAGSFGSELEAFEGNSPCAMLALGFYGDEAERAKGHNEGTSKLPKREFFALNAADLAWGERAIAQRMQIRARRGEAGPSGSGPASAPSTGGAEDRSDWISF